eukprot:GHVT01080407.1.p1 GENE.GHVT01080407.1~~GHVT01080407.1.p1  ORF type:complete len:453 (-),score=75.48 GHVT01080407.1:1152-2510(-)
MTALEITRDDQFAYVATTTGDVLELNLAQCCLTRCITGSQLYPGGVCSLRLLPQGHLLLGTGDGHIVKLRAGNWGVMGKEKVDGSVLSISVPEEVVVQVPTLNRARRSLSSSGPGEFGQSSFLRCFVATSQSALYEVQTDDMEVALRSCCHSSGIKQVEFPQGYSAVFATCAGPDIRIWRTDKKQEVLRICVPCGECLCFCFSSDGKRIISGWADGRLRVFAPITGRLLFAVADAHQQGATAVAITPDGTKIISGGHAGEVRIWKASKDAAVMLKCFQNHRSKVEQIVVSTRMEQAITASADGSVIIWSLDETERRVCLFEPNMFRSVALHPDGLQLLTVGSSRFVTYWDTLSGQQVRSVEAAEEGDVMTIDITKSGSHFITGGKDGRLRVWNYLLGECLYERAGHSDCINSCRISPDQTFIVSVGNDGSILFWDVPRAVQIDASKDPSGSY